MLSLTVSAPKPFFLSTPFLPHHHHLNSPPPPHLSPPPKPLSISALIIPGSSSYSSKQRQKQTQQQQQLYQPYRPPPSPIPSKFRKLDTNGRLDILSNQLGAWFEYAPLIPSLYQEGFTSSTIEEITGIASITQNRLVVASQVRDSLLECLDDETVSFFDSPGAPEILYEIRILNTPQRAAAAKFIIDNEFDGKRAEELARSMKDFPRRYGDRGWQSFDATSPGDCLAYMYFRQAQEHRSAFFPELSKAALERALEVVETESAKKKVADDLERNDSGDVVEVEEDVLVRVPVVRLAYGEVAESSVVVVLPVCRAEGGEVEIKEAPWECGMGGSFGILEAEKAWKQWVVLPGWTPVMMLKSGGVVVAFPRSRDAEEEILVVADRGRKEVEYEDGFYLVVGSGEEGLKVVKGDKLKENGVVVSLGMVVLVVKPPRDDMDHQLGVDEE